MDRKRILPNHSSTQILKAAQQIIGTESTAEALNVFIHKCQKYFFATWDIEAPLSFETIEPTATPTPTPPTKPIALTGLDEAFEI